MSQALKPITVRRRCFQCCRCRKTTEKSEEPVFPNDWIYIHFETMAIASQGQSANPPPHDYDRYYCGECLRILLDLIGAPEDKEVTHIDLEKDN